MPLNVDIQKFMTHFDLRILNFWDMKVKERMEAIEKVLADPNNHSEKVNKARVSYPKLLAQYNKKPISLNIPIKASVVLPKKKPKPTPTPKGKEELLKIREKIKPKGKEPVKVKRGPYKKKDKPAPPPPPPPPKPHSPEEQAKTDDLKEKLDTSMRTFREKPPEYWSDRKKYRIKRYIEIYEKEKNNKSIEEIKDIYLKEWEKGYRYTPKSPPPSPKPKSPKPKPKPKTTGGFQPEKDISSEEKKKRAIKEREERWAEMEEIQRKKDASNVANLTIKNLISSAVNIAETKKAFLAKGSGTPHRPKFIPPPTFASRMDKARELKKERDKIASFGLPVPPHF